MEQKQFEQLFEEWMVLSKKLFPAATPEACIIHAIEECAEASKESNLFDTAVEVGDAIFCLLTFCRLRHISVDDLFVAMSYKYQKNLKREWVLNADKTYSHK